MLRDGEFIKEEPVRIGVYYIVPVRNNATEEEYAIQNVLLNKDSDNSFDVLDLRDMLSDTSRKASHFINLILSKFAKQ